LSRRESEERGRGGEDSKLLKRQAERHVDERVAALVREGQAAARTGQKARARHQFRTVLTLDPANVSALLWLAWLSDDLRASLAYVARALESDPENPHARAALQWARRRAPSPPLQGRPSPSPSESIPENSAEAASTPPSGPGVGARPATSQTGSDAPASGRRWRRPGPGVLAGLAMLGLLIILVSSALVWFMPDGLSAWAALAPTPSSTPTATASPTPTQVATPTSTLTPTPSPTSSPTPTPSPTGTPSLSPTPTVTPTAATPPALPTALPLPPTATMAPPSIPSNIRWIDVDLTAQSLTAYEGLTPVRTTLVSTGLPYTPTPIGQYYIEVRLRYDDMSGPGYYLPNVPYVMYFYRGFGLHGTYWHANFGHPMSHGCINLPTSEAEWLYDWAAVGTFVNIHY